jgi:hypothetical protein
VIVKVVPVPTVLSTVTVPPCAATISCTIYRPNPVPPGLVVYNQIVVGVPLDDFTADVHQEPRLLCLTGTVSSVLYRLCIMRKGV